MALCLFCGAPSAPVILEPGPPGDILHDDVGYDVLLSLGLCYAAMGGRTHYTKSEISGRSITDL